MGKCPHCESMECGFVCRFTGKRRLKGNWRHGHAQKRTGSRTYHSWRSMMMRCYYEKCDGYKYWGGRGITVCERWHDFANFLADMGEKPWGCSLDRINNNGNYEPSNCRWSSVSEQANNKRSSRLLSLDGRTQTMEQWAKELGVRSHAIAKRLRRGWPVEQALRIPVGGVRPGTGGRIEYLKEHEPTENTKRA